MARDEAHRAKFRQALCIALKRHFDALELEMEFREAKLEGQQDRDIACVWFDSKRWHRADGNNEECFFGIRVFRNFKQDQGAAEPQTQVERELDWTFEALEDGLRAVLLRPLLEAASGIDLAGWFDSYFIVQQVEKNHELQFVQASLSAFARNRTARGG